MLNFQFERLRRFPQRPDETWQGGLIRSHSWITGEGSKPYRPWLALWVAVKTGIVGPPIVSPPDEAIFARAVDALLRFANDPEIGGYRPGRVEVCDSALAEHLSGSLRELGITVEYRDRLPEFEQLVAALDQQVGGRPLASDRAYPCAMPYVPGGKTFRPDAAVLAFLEGLLNAFARTTEEQIDSGPWRVAVQTSTGSAEFELAIPDLLDPPAWEDMVKRGFTPDRRALELYAQGVQAGERTLGPKPFEEEAGRFWAMLDTRPCMRARLGRASIHIRRRTRRAAVAGGSSQAPA